MMTPELWNIYLRLQSKSSYGSPLSALADLNLVKAWNLDFKLQNNSKVLLVGPGSLSEVVACEKTFPHHNIHVLAVHSSVVTLIKSYNSNVQVLLGDIHCTNYDTGFFDAVIAWQVFEHTFAPYIVLMECRRILKSTGQLFFVVPSFEGSENGHNGAHISCLSHEMWKELMRKTGFQITRESIEDTASKAKYYSFVGKPGILRRNHNQLLQEIIQLKAK